MSIFERLFNIEFRGKEEIAQVGDVSVQASHFRMTTTDREGPDTLRVHEQKLLSGGPSDEYITVKQAHSEFGISEDELRELARTHVLKAEKYGNAWQIHRRSLQQYVEKMKRNR